MLVTKKEDLFNPSLNTPVAPIDHKHHSLHHVSSESWKEHDEIKKKHFGD